MKIHSKEAVLVCGVMSLAACGSEDPSIAATKKHTNDMARDMLARDMKPDMTESSDMGSSDMSTQNQDMNTEMDMGGDMTVEIDMGPTCVDGPMELNTLKSEPTQKIDLTPGTDVRVSGNDYRTFGEEGVDIKGMKDVLPNGDFNILTFTHRRLSTDPNFDPAVHALFSKGEVIKGDESISYQIIYRDFAVNVGGTLNNFTPSLEVSGTWEGQTVVGRGSSADFDSAVVISYKPNTGAWKVLKNGTFEDQNSSLCPKAIAEFKSY